MGGGGTGVGSTGARATAPSVIGAGARVAISALGNGLQAAAAKQVSIHDALDFVPSYLAPGPLEHPKTTERPMSRRSGELSNDFVARPATMVRFPRSRYQSTECSGS